MGADVVLDFTAVDPVSEVKRLTGGRGVDVAIEALGAPLTFENALGVLRPRGTLSSVYSGKLSLPVEPFAADARPGADAALRGTIETMMKGEHRMKLRRILVPVDFSATSLQALDRAIDFGKQFEAELLILFVIEPVIYAGLADLDGTSANLQALLQSQQRAGSQELARLAAQLKKRRVRFRTRLQIGQPWAVIVNEAKKSRADLIVMATHGRAGLSHLFMGSVAEKVVRSATCPVLTIRPSAHKPRQRVGG